MSRRAIRFLLVAAVLVVPAVACAGTPVPYLTPKPKPKPAVKVTVIEYEYGYRLSRTTVPHGKVQFVMGNAGAIPHNFVIAGKVGPYLVTGQRASMTVTLPKKGSYTYYCSVKYHAGQGMQGTLTVK